MDLQALGWNDSFAESFQIYQQKGLRAGRIISQGNGNYVVSSDGKPALVRVTGKFRYNAKTSKDFPVVGDWVAMETKEQSPYLLIHAILPRENAFTRKLAISGGRKLKNGIIDGGRTEKQVIAANIDTAFIIVGLDNNFSIRRIERFLTLVYNSGIEPVIILNKVDLCHSTNKYVEQVKSIASTVPIHAISAERGINMNVFSNYLYHGRTVMFLGSSGVGKSTITNYLLGQERQKKQAISMATGKGKHTTTKTDLIFHHSGGMIIDTPGVRELQLWGDEETLGQSFEDITQLTSLCRFTNCRHENEPGCAIRKAIEDKELDQKRFESYQQQLMELQRLERKRRVYEKTIKNKNKGLKRN